jgi:metal-sulfur cluster biosynthetic enzyme
MTLTAPGCGMGPVLVEEMKYRLQKVPNLHDVEVELVFDPPWDRDMMSDEAKLELGMF